jgi:signal transduction histidine kinase
MSAWRRSVPVGVLVALLAVTACTLAIGELADIAPKDSLGPVYLIAVVLVAANWGTRLGVLTALASAAAFDYFHISPGHRFEIPETRNGVALVVFLVAALLVVMVAGLSQRVRELQALRRREAESRARVLAAADEERRRVVRDLHDGAQQRLVHTVITLKLARRELAGGAAADALVAEALGHAEQATRELRELAHGILPATLTRGGLRAGVDSLVSRTPLPVALEVSDERVDPTVEATAYFVVSEALTNAVKHAAARQAAVRAWVDGGALQVEVSDDGVGGAHVNGSSGLLGLQDRVAALDGRLSVDSAPGAGTVIRAILPLRR